MVRAKSVNVSQSLGTMMVYDLNYLDLAHVGGSAGGGSGVLV